MGTKSLKHTPKDPAMKNERRIEITISIPMSEKGRRATLADVHRAGSMAGVAARTALESTRKPYEIDGDVEVSSRYIYVHEERRQSQ